MKKNNGFTMLEMITVIAIMGIVSAIAIPYIISYASTYRLRSAADDLYSNLEQARVKAIQENRRWAVNFSTSGYQVVNCGPDNDCTSTTASDDIIAKDIVMSRDYPGITMVQTFAGNQIVFNSEGTCDTSAAGNVTFSKTGQALPRKVIVITVYISGGIASSWIQQN